MRRKLTVPVLVAFLAAGVAAAPAAEAHRSSGPEAERALKGFAALPWHVDLDGATTDTGDTLFVEQRRVGGNPDLPDKGGIRETRHKVLALSNYIEGTGSSRRRGLFSWSLRRREPSHGSAHTGPGGSACATTEEDPEREAQAFQASVTKRRGGTPAELSRAVERRLAAAAPWFGNHPAPT